jgi:type II secretory pathway component GspD/PulD (secretin)
MLKHLSPLSLALVAILVATGLFFTAAARAAETPTKSIASPKAVDQGNQPTPKPTVESAAHRAVEAARKPLAETSPAKPQRLRFQFAFMPWKDVLDWFAKQADLSLVMDAPPPGTFNYRDTHEYTPTEAIDLLNSVLLTKGYTLIRRNRMLMLVNLEDGIPANLVSTVPVNSLDSRGEFEVVRVIFDLEKLRPEEAEPEIKKLLGPQGTIVALGKSRQIAVTETAGRLRAIRTVLARMEGTDGAMPGGLRAIELKFARSEDVLPIVRQMLEIPEDKNVAADGSIRIALEAGGGRLFVSGQPDKVARAVDIIRGLDVPAPGADAAGRIAGTPQIEVYSVPNADAQAAMSVLQTLLAGQPDVRLMVDPKSNSVVALARPAQQATIRATLAQLQREGQRVEVIRLTRLDPDTVLTSINKLFPAGDAGKGTAPLVDADESSRQLMIRGTEAQISQIRGMLQKMGEVVPGLGESTQRGRVRTLTLTDSNARSALERIQEIWPTLRPNRIRIVSPSVAVDEQPANERPEGLPPALLDRLRDLKRPNEPPPKSTAPDETPSGGNKSSRRGATPSLPAEHSTRSFPGAPIVYVAEHAATSPPAESNSAAPIVVMPGPHGLIIASEDTEALDEFERLLDLLAENGGTSGRKISVFYLKYAKVAAVTETLGQIMAGSTTSAPAASNSGGGGNPMMGMFGGPFGGFGGPFGGGGGGRRNRGSADSSDGDGATTATVNPSAGRTGLATGPIKITADQRLNALLVRANRADLDTIAELLKVLDQKESPEDISIATRPRMIAVENSSAEEIADIVKQVYADRMVENPTANARGGFFAMMAARAGGQSRPAQGDVAKLSIGIDPRTNSLIVAAPDALFEEVRQLVAQLDTAAGEQSQTVRVVTLHRTSSLALEEALGAIAGSSVKVTRTTGASGSGMGSPPYQPSYGNQQQSGYSRRGQYGQGQYGSGQYGQGQYGQGQYGQRQYGQGQYGQRQYGQGRQGQYGQGQPGQGGYGQGRYGQGQYGGPNLQSGGGNGPYGQNQQGGGRRGGRSGQFPQQGAR